VKRRNTSPSTALRAERYALCAGWFMARVNACPSDFVVYGARERVLFRVCSPIAGYEEAGLGGADYHDAGGAGGFAAEADFDDYVVLEGGGEVHEALDGEAFELVALEGGDFGLIDAEDAGGFGLREFAVGEDSVDDETEAELGVEFFGVGQAEVGKGIAGARCNRVTFSLCHGVTFPYSHSLSQFQDTSTL
jgi:hypothetical protein